VPQLAERNSFTVQPGADERDSIDELAELLRTSLAGTRAKRGEEGVPQAILVINNRELPIPATITAFLEYVSTQLAAGGDVMVFPSDAELRTGEAAKMLNVSRQYLVRLCEEGKLPYRMEGTHRRLTLRDVLAYRQRRDEERIAKFRELVAKSVEAGEYDLPITWPPR